MALWTGFPTGTGKIKLSEDAEICDENKIVLKCLARSQDFERKLSTKFVMSDDVPPPFLL